MLNFLRVTNDSMLIPSYLAQTYYKAASFSLLGEITKPWFVGMFICN